MRSLLSELARVSHSAQVTGRGGFQGHAGLKNRETRATGHGTPTRSAWPGARLPLGVRARAPAGPGGAPRPPRWAQPDSRGLADASGLRAFGKAHRIPARLPGHAHGENGSPGTTVTQ